jgi:shikimate dehydrogenase
VKDLRSINFNTRVCAVIGNPVSHSLSPAIHNAGYEALDLDFLYIPARSKTSGALWPE